MLLTKNNLSILLVEDSLEDFEALENAFHSQGNDLNIFHCEDGDDALDFVFQQGGYADKSSAPRPKVILLDLNLPGTDGKEVLREIKSNPEYRRIPVVIFSTSNNPSDIHECYNIGANGYIQKPMNYDHFETVVDKFKKLLVRDFMPPQWCNLNKKVLKKCQKRLM